MSVLDRLASLQGRRDETPNQELARELAATRNGEGIREIAQNLLNKDKNIQSDCIKVLYEVGYIQPEMIEEYVADFLQLLRSRDNRLVWGGMLALSTIANAKADEIYDHLDLILSIMKGGSVIAVDNAVKVLAATASGKAEFNKQIFPILLDNLRTCRPKEVPQHAESTMPAVNQMNQTEFLKVLEERQSSLTKAQATRINQLKKKLPRVP